MRKSKTTKSLRDMVQQADASKKVNPLDLSSDQDLTVALMNLISLEEHFFFSGAKTQKTGFYDFINIVSDIRQDLMSRIVQDDAVLANVSRKLLGASMRITEVGTKALAAGNKESAYKLFDQAYELYALFWGVNMGLIDLSGVQQAAPDVFKGVTSGCPLHNDGDASPDSRFRLRKLGDWVKNKVNCCIE